MTKFPKYGDPDILPRGTVTRPTAGRMPFDTSGDLLPAGVPDRDDTSDLTTLIAKSWIRKPGQAWTTRAMRDVIFPWLTTFMAGREWAHTWRLEELRQTARGGVLAKPALSLVITERSGAETATSYSFAGNELVEPGLSAALATMSTSLDMQRA